MAGLVASLARMSLSADPSHMRRPQASASPCSCSFSFSSSLRGSPVLTASRRPAPVRATVFQVEAKQNSLQRQRTSEKARLYNKSRKSAIATRVKKALVAITATRTNMPSSEAELSPIDKLISEAYSEIDKAIVKGVIHKNTGGRRKSRIAIARRKLLEDAGLYAPTAATA